MGALPFLALGYFVYGRWISKAIGVSGDRPTPSHTINDGSDYVPTKTTVLFGHHFASIAGAGPIIGPALAVLYGYLPVWLWLVVGAVFIGAVHDFTAMFVSIRESGKSMAEVAKHTLGRSGSRLGMRL